MTQAASLTGTVLDGKYAIDRLLGEGGMGAVYRARHLGTKRVVALKVIVPRMTRSAEFVERFRREAESAGGLRHPNVVDVTDFGFAQVGAEQIAYLVMEYLDGCTLAEVLAEEKRLPLDWVVDIVEQTCSAVEEAHRAGIIHRDLKPQNIWLEPNRRGGYTVKVLDFGLAKVRDSGLREAQRFQTGSLPPLPDGAGGVDTVAMRAGGMATQVSAPAETAVWGSGGAGAGGSGGGASQPTLSSSPAQELTQVGTVLGTPYYMSPEQCRGQGLDARSDIYSLAVIAYEVLSGERPFPGTAPLDVMAKHLTETPRHLSELCPKIPKAVADVVMSALEKEPDNRPQTADLFASTFRATAEGAGALLRRAVVLVTENFHAFLRLFAVAFLPLFGLRIVELLADLAEPRVPPGLFRVWLVTFGIVSIVATFVAGAVTRGVAALLLTQLAIAPLRDVKLHLAFGALKKRLGPLVLGSLFYVVAVAVPLAIFVASLRRFAGDSMAGVAGSLNIGMEAEAVVELGIAIVAGYVTFKNFVRYSLFPIGLLIEGKGVRESLRRSKELVAQGRRYIVPIAVLEIMESVVEVALFGLLAPLVANRAVRDFVVGASATGLEFVIAPVTAVAYATIYLKLRQARGESTRDMLKEQLVEQEIPRSRWLQRMHKSWATRSGSSFGGPSGSSGA